MSINSKRAAMEMTMGTMVTIVVLVTVLILGLVFVRTVFTSARGAIDLTDQQLRNELSKLFGEESRISIYPGNRFIEIKQEDLDGVGIGIRNVGRGATAPSSFSYEVVVSDPDLQTKCGVSEQTAESWIVTGRAENNIPIAPGAFSSQKVLFEIPTGAPLCTVRFRALVTPDIGDKFSDFFDISIKAK